MVTLASWMLWAQAAFSLAAIPILITTRNGTGHTTITYVLSLCGLPLAGLLFGWCAIKVLQGHNRARWIVMSVALVALTASTVTALIGWTNGVEPGLSLLVLLSLLHPTSRTWFDSVSD